MLQGVKIKVTWDIAFSQIQHVTLVEISEKEMQHCHFLKSTCNIWDPPSRDQRWSHVDHVNTRRPITQTKGGVDRHWSRVASGERVAGKLLASGGRSERRAGVEGCEQLETSSLFKENHQSPLFTVTYWTTPLGEGNLMKSEEEAVYRSDYWGEAIHNPHEYRKPF